MNEERWAELKTAFAELVDLPPPARARRVAELGESDPEMAQHLERLLAADGEAPSSLWPFDLVGPRSTEESGSGRPAPPPDPFGLTGRMVSHFRVQEVLGSGGMGVLYRAEDVRLGRTVALKFLLPQHSVDPAAKERFGREARAVSALDHPNICTIYEVGETDEGRIFLAMACYAGVTLRERLAASGPPLPGEAMDIAKQVLLGLGAAHGAGIIHRDLKPGNLMLTADGTVKILDFGLAKMKDPNLSDPDLRPGTVAYMSPEQIEGRPVDVRTDLWSLGVVVYEMLTGRAPFGGGHELGTIYSILNEEPPPPSSLRDQLPPALDRVVGRLLRKEPRERYASTVDVLADLELESNAAAAGPRPRRVTRSPGLAAGLALLAVAAVTSITVALRERAAGDPAAGTSAGARTTSSPEQASLAVLPFLDLSPERDQEYFSDGITEELISHLSRVEGLRVPARTSSFQFKGRGADVREVGDRLGVAHVLEGSVRRAGDQLRITVQLVSTGDGYPVWSETYDVRTGDVFAVQDEISRAIVDALRLRLAPNRSPPAPAASVEAYERFLRGRFFALKRTEDALVTAAAYYREAIALDPGFARAYAGLAETYVTTRDAAPAERFRLGREAALQALALDGSLAEAHAVMGWITMWYDRDWEGAEAHFRDALATNPGSLLAHQWYSAFLAARGRSEEAVAEIRAAVRIDPLSITTITHLGTVLFWQGRHDEAIGEYRRALELDPGFFMAHWGLSRAFLETGRTEEAIEELAYQGTDYVGFFRSGLLGHAYAVAGREQEARAILDALHARREGGSYVAPTEFAAIHIGLGETAEAFEWLERHEADRGARIFLRLDPMFDPLRSSPRFDALLERLGLR